MSGERVFRELKEHVDRFPRVSHAYFIGSLLNGDLRALERFCDRALESGMRLSWEGQAIVDPRMDRRLLGKMARAGCVWLGFGIESGSEALRGRMNKGFSNEDALRNLKDAHDAGIRVQANFMFGLPTETREDFEQTLRFLTLCRPHIDSVLASQSFAVLDKGTALHRRAGEFGIEGRDHHLYWTSDNGTNDYAERFRRYEKFCSLALELGLPETSGVLRVKPDKWLLLGRYHMRREDYSSAVRCLERSALEEAAGRSARADLAECRERSIAVNRKELEERKTALSAPPRLLTLGTHHPCNARCVFCLEGEAPRFSLELYKSRFEARLGHFIRRAEKVTFTGFGEVLLAPDAPAWLDHLNATIPETWKIFTTNGTPLRGEIVERLLKSRYVVQLSLHAADSALHEELTGLKGAFQGIVRSLGELCSLRRERDLGDRLHVVLVSVVTRRSAGSLADLVRLAWELKVPEVQCHYVTVFNEAHIPQSCFFDQERANEAIAAAQEALDRIRSGADPEEAKHFQVSLPPRFGAGQDSRAGSVCPEPWEHVYVEAQGPVLPCCQWGEHIGNLDAGDDLDALWNGPFYRGFRSSMASGDPHPWCGRCARYRGYNVDNLLCHLTNRPEQQKALLEAIGTWTRA
jgi:MoaA/NifB/PqqE/SkfB family radical SAM enzyme